MRAFLKNNRQAPRKVRLIARAVIGKNVAVALTELAFMPHKGAGTLKKLIESAVANAQQTNADIKPEDLKIHNITVDKGTTFVRYRPRAFGRAAPIHKENSHIRVELTSVKEAVPTAKDEVVAEKAKEDKKEGRKEERKVTKEIEKKEDKKAETKKKTTATKSKEIVSKNK